MMADLEYKIETVDGLGDDTVIDMFTLYNRYYDGTSEQLFRRDLAEKQFVIVLRDQNSQLQGFSTAMVGEHQFQGQRLRSFFSGDTIVDKRHWGQQGMQTALFRLTGHTKAAEPGTPLYWFLLVKGHRTYRFLPTFFKAFYPAHARETPPREKALMDMLARDRYGDAYDVNKGLVSYESSHGHLKPALVDIPTKDRRRPDVRFFLERNPGYVDGDELVCLAEFTQENLKPVAARLFDQGLQNPL